MKSAFAAVAISLAALPAAAQTVNANNLINVNVSNVANNLARDLDVNVSQIPVTVQIPVGVAATVCNVSAAVLAQGGDAGGTCTAETTSQALNQAVSRQLIQQ